MTQLRLYRNHGHTLLELIVVIAIGIIVTAFAAPAFTNTFASVRADQTATDLFSALVLARSTAIQQDQYAVICATGENNQCGSDWTNGFMVFVDDNGNTLRDEKETVLQQFPASPADSTITLRLFTNRNKVTYLPDGSLKQFTAGSFTYCPGDGDVRHARHILINRIGRARKALDMNQNGIADDSNGKDITCD